MEEILRMGYVKEYDEVFSIYEELPLARCNRVWDILSMADAIYLACETASKEEIEALEEDPWFFKGFDGNNETAELLYCKFIIEKMERFTHLKNKMPKNTDFNTHFPTNFRYDPMLSMWKSLPTSDRCKLSMENVKKILNSLNK